MDRNWAGTLTLGEVFTVPLTHIVVFLEVIDKNFCPRMRQQEKWKPFLSRWVLQASKVTVSYRLEGSAGSVSCLD